MRDHRYRDLTHLMSRYHALLMSGFVALSLALTGCEEMVEPPPKVETPVLSPEARGFTPDRERVVGFPGARDDSLSIAEQEATQLSAMHERGGTGTGQLVGTFDLGASPQHPDLTGKFPHVCAMGNCDDGRPNRSDHSPHFDTNGHGTLVNGIIAAAKNGVGVYGVAYEAQIASFGVDASVRYPWGNECVSNCPPGVADRLHQWSELFDQEIARGIDWMSSLGVRVTNLSWGRAYTWSRDREQMFGITAIWFRRIMPRTLAAFESYVGAGGVAVWAAGNEGGFHPGPEAMVPRYIPALEKGWLAVIALNADGVIADYSNACGDAADWCIAAPGELVTTNLDGLWRSAAGTSFAAPYVSAAVAALKSMFPHLTYHQLRARILATADRRPPYHQREVYGAGRLDLDAASRSMSRSMAGARVRR